jgi:hypothetical protein
VLGVEGFAEEQLSAEPPLRTLGGDDLIVLGALPLALGGDGDDAVLDGQVDARRFDAGKVEADDELVPVAVGVHRHYHRGERVSRTLPG